MVFGTYYTIIVFIIYIFIRFKKVLFTHRPFIRQYRYSLVIKLKPGDFIYIMGLKMVVGSNYIALNNPDEKLKIKSDSIGIGRTQVARNSDENIPEQPEKQFFSRSPRFRKEIEHAEVKIDPPPPLEKEETVPLALMIGPSITMGMTSVSTGLISLINGINGGNMASVIPTLLMSSCVK